MIYHEKEELQKNYEPGAGRYNAFFSICADRLWQGEGAEYGGYPGDLYPGSGLWDTVASG